jgi:hypothetical protein
MGTWLDLRSPVTVKRALGSVADGSNADRRFDLWLLLVDLHLEELRSVRSGLAWDWQRGYEDGWSPRSAAFAGWAQNVQAPMYPMEPVPTEEND